MKVLILSDSSLVVKCELGYQTISFGGYLSHDSIDRSLSIPHVSGFRWPVVQLYTATSFGLSTKKGDYFLIFNGPVERR